MARAGASSSRLETEADSRISRSPIRCTVATFEAKVGACGSTPTRASANRAAWSVSRRAASGSMGTAGSAPAGVTGVTGAGGTSTGG
jgi:hypothetical protein